jgi:hypothetical protein
MADDTLTLDPDTLETLGHFESISADGGGSYAGGLRITPGNVLRVSNKFGRLVARATLSQTFSRGFAIYDLRRFNGALSAFKSPVLTIRDGYVLITDTDPSVALSVKYPICRPDMITTVDEDPDIEAEIAFALSRDNLKTILDIAANLGAPNIVIAGQAGKLQLGALDVLKPLDGRCGAKLPVGTTDRNFLLAFLARDWRKLKLDAYKIAVAFRPGSSREGGIHAVSTDGARDYWLLSQTAPSGLAAKKARDDTEVV